MEEAFAYEACASDDIANVLEPRARFIPEASAVHLTRREALLAVRLQPPDLSIYPATLHPAVNETSEFDTMEHSKEPQARAMSPGAVDHSLRDLKRACIAQHDDELATQAAGKQGSHGESWARLLEGEAHVRRDRTTHNRIRQARFPVIKTLDPF